MQNLVVKERRGGGEETIYEECMHGVAWWHAGPLDLKILHVG